MRSSVGLLLAVASLPAFSQDPRAFSNKLAPYVASPARVVDLMLEMARIKPGETVYDLGSGDGRILVAAAGKYKAKAVGIEISPKLVASATSEIERAGLSAQARVMQGDVLQTDFTGADVVTLYLETELNAKLRPRLEKFLKPGARVVSHDYPVPGWKAARVEKIEGRQTHTIYLYEIQPPKQ
ncbi:MAG TPA: methyltransferase domain-containing protein [Bryobacteraceae bacterium]